MVFVINLKLLVVASQAKEKIMVQHNINDHIIFITLKTHHIENTSKLIYLKKARSRYFSDQKESSQQIGRSAIRKGFKTVNNEEETKILVVCRKQWNVYKTVPMITHFKPMGKPTWLESLAKKKKISIKKRGAINEKCKYFVFLNREEFSFDISLSS